MYIPPRPARAHSLRQNGHVCALTRLLPPASVAIAHSAAAVILWGCDGTDLPVKPTRAKIRLRLRDGFPRNAHDSHLVCSLADRENVPPSRGESTTMRSVQHDPANPWPERSPASLAKRVAGPLATLLAVAAASFAAFVAVVWFDDSMRVFSPAVIRLGPAKAHHGPPLPWPISALPRP